MRGGADNPIKILFGGNATGSVTVNSGAPVVLDGLINNPNGATSIAADGSITGTSNGSIVTQNLSLTATGGPIGASPQSLINASLAAGGVLTAQGSSVYLNLNSGALIKQVTASETAVSLANKQWNRNSCSSRTPIHRPSTRPSTGRSMATWVVNATGSLDPVNSSSYIQGRTITLTSANGGVGDTAPLTIEPMQDGSLGGGVVNITALGDINIASQGTNLITGGSGDLLIGLARESWLTGIVSKGGNVTISVPGGAILDASNETSGEALSQSQLQQIWTNLHLLASAGAQDNATALFEKQVDSDYQQYGCCWRNGSEDAGTSAFSLNAGSVANFASLAAAYLGINPASVGDANIHTYGNDLYQSLTGSFSATFGSSWATQAPFQTFQAGFQYTATAAQAAAQGQAATWTLAELEDAVDETALQQGTTVGSSAPPNIAGRDVSLTAGGSIGKLLPPLQICVTSAALAAPTIISVLAASATRKRRRWPLPPCPARSPRGRTGAANGAPNGGHITVQQIAPLFVDASGTFSGHSNATIYLQSTGQTLFPGSGYGARQCQPRRAWQYHERT